MKGAFVYNQETGCVPKSELKMSVYEHGQFLRLVFFLERTIFCMRFTSGFDIEFLARTKSQN